MAVNDLGGVWRTVGGRRIFIKEGQDLATAMKESGKFEKENQTETKKTKSDFEILEEQANSEALNKDYSNAKDRIQEMASEYYKEIGYNEKPILVSNSEYEDEKKQNAREIARGIRGYGEKGKNGKDFLEQYKNGDTYIGNQRVFGSGTYYTYEKDAVDTIQRYSNKDGITYTALLKKDTKIITNQKLNEMKVKYTNDVLNKANGIYKTDPEKAREYYNKMNNIINSDNGIFASSLGYEAIDVEDAKYIVSLNRGKIILKK